MRQVLGGVLVAVVFGVAAWWWYGGHALPPSDPELTIVSVGAPPAGKDWPQVNTLAPVHAALQGSNPKALLSAMGDAGVQGIWVPSAGQAIGESPGTDTAPLAEWFARALYVEGFAADTLGPEGVIYIAAPDVPEELAQRVLARAARSILAGSEPPPSDVFPDAFRREQSVEVLVAVKDGPTLRLWRSARDWSTATALSLAAIAARDRWSEREDVLGGPLKDVLPRLTVEVWLLLEDGTIAEGAEPLIDRLITPSHGVGLEQPTRWRYLLPGEVRREGSGLAAFRTLFSQNDLPPDRLFRSDRRLYRFVAKTVSVDAPGSEAAPVED